MIIIVLLSVSLLYYRVIIELNSCQYIMYRDFILLQSLSVQYVEGYYCISVCVSALYRVKIVLQNVSVRCTAVCDRVVCTVA
jgi:hypothetical protein